MTALTWALEIGDPQRFASIGDAVSYCGLTSALVTSADKQQRGPISKQRNPHLQRVLIEAAKLAPRWNPLLAAVHEQERKQGHRNRATLEVARKLVAYLLAVDKSGKRFVVRLPSRPEAGGEASGLKNLKLTSGKVPFPPSRPSMMGGCQNGPAVQGSLRRARSGAPLTSSGPFRRKTGCDGRLRREIRHTRSCASHERLRSDPPAVPRFWGLHEGEFLAMCPYSLFRGRPDSLNSIFVDGLRLFPQMDVWSRSRVGPTLNESLSTSRANGPRTSTLRFRNPSRKAGRRVSLLDKSLSWMSLLPGIDHQLPHEFGSVHDGCLDFLQLLRNV